jgi:diguanylate cyclase (GGDEF)-like protein
MGIAVSLLGPRSGFGAVDEGPVRRLRLMRMSVYWVVVAAGAGLTVAALPSAVAFMSGAEFEFWILVALALVADVRPVMLPAPMRRSTTFVVSVCFCFVILLLYGAPAAIVVEIGAVGVAARKLRLSAQSWAYLSARLVCSFAVAGAVRGALGVSGDEVRNPLGIAGVLGLALIAAAFVAVSCTISVARAVMSRATRSEIVMQLRFETLARGAVVVAAAVIATTPSAASLLLLFIPLFGWTQLARLLADQDRRREHDPITGLLSADGLAGALADLRRDRQQNAEWFGVSLIQLRGMPYVSRNVGQASAEHVMSAAAERLRNFSEPGDLIGRLSESEFVVVRPNLSAGGAIDSARGVVSALSAPVESREGVPFRLDPVAGVALAPGHGRDLGQLMPHAEAALFDAAVHGRVAAVYEPEAPSDVDDRLALLGRLQASMGNPEHASEIVMLFQPQVAVDTGRTNSVEALLRWYDPVHGLVPTDELMRLVEPTGVMQQLTTFVLDRVAAQLAEWNRAGLRLRAAMNVSALDLRADDFDTQVEETLRRHRIVPGQLDIEITERSMVDDTVQLDEAAQRLARLGVGLSLDDFGTGFASLRRLRRLPLTEVKIDRSYVSKIADSSSDRVIVGAIHDMARVLGLRLVAEGVEDEATVRVLADLHSVIGQGWYFARPMSAVQLLEWLNKRRA